MRFLLKMPRYLLIFCLSRILVYIVIHLLWFKYNFIKRDASASHRLRYVSGKMGEGANNKDTMTIGRLFLFWRLRLCHKQTNKKSMDDGLLSRHNKKKKNICYRKKKRNWTKKTWCKKERSLNQNYLNAPLEYC